VEVEEAEEVVAAHGGRRAVDAGGDD
jgi:hypothetical protein